MTKLVKSLVQRFHLDMELCPQTSTRQSASGLRYLIHRKYDDNAIGKRTLQLLKLSEKIQYL